MSDDPVIVGVWDKKLNRPACVIIQAIGGGDRRVSTIFPAESWLTNITDDMVRIEAPLSDWRKLRDKLYPRGGETK